LTQEDPELLAPIEALLVDLETKLNA